MNSVSIIVGIELIPYSGFTKATTSANYNFWLLGLEPTIQETEANQSRGPEQGCRSIEFQDVQFSYPLAPSHCVLKGVSLAVCVHVYLHFTVKLTHITAWFEPGNFVALVGASGCGKSTMISLLERFYDPDSGK